MTRIRPYMVAASLAAVGVLAASAATSGATTAGSGQSYSAAANAGTVSPITPSIKVCVILTSCTTGVLSAVTGSLGSLLTSVTSIVSDIQAIPSSVVSAVTGSGLSASQPAVQLSRPSPQSDPSTGAPNLPTCGQQGWDASGAGDCYAGLPVVVPASAVLGVNVTGVGGYATDDTTGYIGAAQAAGVKLSLLGGSLGTIGTVWSQAYCANSTTTPNCQASSSTVTASMLPSAAYPAGALNLKIANTGDPQVLSLNGAALSGTNKTVAVTGLGSVTVAVTNHLLTLTIALSTSQLTTLIPTLAGLGALISHTDSGTLTIAIGPGSTSTTSGATASGLSISADLALALKLSTLGIASVDITTGAGISSPDLLNLQVAYSSATAGTATASWVGPGLI